MFIQNGLNDFELKSITAVKTIQELRNIFARTGSKRRRAQFTAAKYALFMTRNSICHIQRAVAKMLTNGLVERFNGTFKLAIKAMDHQTSDMNFKINSMPLFYRNTSHSTISETPANMFYGRNLCNKLDLVTRGP